ncbi:DUF1876 domain-containing protein [Candidatus Protofrankia californiensis]|uniref:DUF1876 domain-containing protein n=1 Tax=Candidatus Protofrankia californiensis TaxID=1839754 RepID=UPI001041BAA7|nr:DUF1876 domain-containing protein [Candidatus Protofrankia californiensis]
MIHTKRWTVDVLLTEDDGHTRAEAALRPGPRSDSERELRGVGHARRHPTDTEVPEIGDEVSASRALSELAHRLLDAAAGDIEAITHQTAHLRMPQHHQGVRP